MSKNKVQNYYYYYYYLPFNERPHITTIPEFIFCSDEEHVYRNKSFINCNSIPFVVVDFGKLEKESK